MAVVRLDNRGGGRHVRLGTPPIRRHIPSLQSALPSIVGRASSNAWTGQPDTDGHGATKSRAELTVLTCLTPVVLMRDQVVGEPWRGPLCQARSRW
jgi:hypothetical protein